MAISTYSLISLDSVKSFIGLLGANTDNDAILESLIDSVSALFETYCDRNFLTRAYEELHDGSNKVKLFTDQYPITTVTSIHDDYDWDWGSDTEISTSSYRISGNDRYVVFKDTYLLDYRQNVKIVYVAGYSTTPYDLEQACIEEVARIYKNKNQIDVISKSLADGSVSYINENFLPRTKTVLDKYRRISLS